MKSLTALLAAALAATVTGCGQQGTAGRPANVAHADNPPAASDTSTRDEDQRKAEAALRDLEARIAELKRQAAQAGAEAKPVIEQQLRELDEKAAVAHKKLDELRAAAPDIWRDIKAGLDNAVDDLR